MAKRPAQVGQQRRGHPAGGATPSAAAPRLAWETTVAGTGAEGVSRLTVDVDAATGAVLRTPGARHATAPAPAPGTARTRVTLDTTQSGSTLHADGPDHHQPAAARTPPSNTTFSGTDDVWGNGTATDRETGCVDALFAAQTEDKMLSQWLGRNGMDGAGGAWPIRVGLNDENAFYDGTQVQIGHNTANQWIGSIDVVGHEMGHGIDDHTPGGISGSGTQEFVADTFGAATEWFANEPAPFDTPDFLVGEEINLVGSGPIRNMYNPSRGRRPELLLQQRSPAPRCTPRPVPATTGSTCSPRAPTRPTASRPARPATAPRSPASASRTPSRSCTTRC